MKRVWWWLFLLIALPVAAQDAGNTFSATNSFSKELVSSGLETNSWDTAVEKWKRGLQQLDVFNVNAVATGNYIVMGSFSNTWATSLQGEGRIIGKCSKEHVDDYPVVTTRVQGVQKVRVYKQVISIEGKTVETKWRIYSYPHKKLTETTTVKLIKKVEKDTKTEDTTEPHACDLCGKE